MNIVLVSNRLRAFRFFGATERWEDNVTRALLCVITRTLSGGMILRGLLELLVDQSRYNTGPTAELANELLKELPGIKSASVDTQVKFTPGQDMLHPDSEFAIVIELIPGNRPPDSYVTPPEPDDSGGRLDGLLEFRTRDDRTFLVAIESKLYGQEANEKLAKYATYLNPKRSSIVSIKWSEVLEVIDRLPALNRSEPLVEDFVEYLESFYWLAGFRGFSEQHFSSDGQNGRVHQLKTLIESLCIGKAETAPFAMSHQQTTDACDFDLYAWDQFRLLGNLGLASWDDESLYAKLVLGSFQFYDDPTLPERRSAIQRHSGLTSPIATSFWGIRRLLDVDSRLIAAEFEKLATLLPEAEATIHFRCFFGRFHDIWLSSKPRKVTSWKEIDLALRLAELVGKPVSHETLAEIQPFLDCSKANEHALTRINNLLNQPVKNARTPTHHASLLIADKIDLGKLIHASTSLQVAQKVVREKLDPMLETLRAVSELAFKRATER